VSQRHSPALAPWAAAISRAIQDPRPVADDALLLVRDPIGQPIRQAAPRDGIIAREAGVLMLLYPADGRVTLPLTLRSRHLAHHRGEVSLPGGAIDRHDDGPVAAALRESDEELGISVGDVSVIGGLTPIYTARSNYRIHPVVGIAHAAPAFRVNRAEVERVITVTLDELLDPALVAWERRRFETGEYVVPYFAIDGQRVWGATALILSEFIARLRRTADGATPPPHDEIQGG
jgi:8-oxo-dGTP pyrophosphatase MutT (NUDIX family)